MHIQILNFLTFIKMAYPLSEPSQNHWANSMSERGYPSKRKRVDCALHRPPSSTLRAEATIGAWDLASKRLTTHKSYVSLKANTESLCHKVQISSNFHLPCQILKFRANVAQLKVSSYSLLIPSVWKYCPPQSTHAHRHPCAHTPLNHRDDTLSSHNILSQLWPIAHLLLRISLEDLEEWFSNRQQIFRKLKSIRYV